MNQKLREIKPSVVLWHSAYKEGIFVESNEQICMSQSCGLKQGLTI